MSTPLHVSLHHERGVPVLSVVGELDLFTAQVLRVRGGTLVRQALAPSPEPVRVVSDEPTRDADPASSAASDIGQGHPSGDERVQDVVVLDVAQVPFVDSAGLGAVVAVLKEVRSHHAGLSIAGASDQMQAVLDLMGLTRIVALHATAGEAVHAALGTSEPSPRTYPEE